MSKLKDILKDVLWSDKVYGLMRQYISYSDIDEVVDGIIDAIYGSGKISISSEALDEQDPAFWEMEATELDGYTHGETGCYCNAMEAFIAATEHSPDYHKEVKIRRISDEEFKQKYNATDKDVERWKIFKHK